MHPLPQHPGPLTLGSLKSGQGGRLPCSPQYASLPAQHPQDKGHQSLGWRQRFKPFPTDRAPPMGCQAPGLSGSTGFPDSFYGCSPSRTNSPSPATEQRRDLRALFVLGIILWEARVGRGWGGCDSAHAALISGDRGAEKWGPALAGDREFRGFTNTCVGDKQVGMGHVSSMPPQAGNPAGNDHPTGSNT